MRRKRYTDGSIITPPAAHPPGLAAPGILKQALTVMTNLQKVRYYHSGGSSDIEHSATVTHDTAHVAILETTGAPKRVHGWPDTHMICVRCHDGVALMEMHVGCNADGTPTEM